MTASPVATDGVKSTAQGQYDATKAQGLSSHSQCAPDHPVALVGQCQCFCAHQGQIQGLVAGDTPGWTENLKDFLISVRKVLCKLHQNRKMLFGARVRVEGISKFVHIFCGSGPDRPQGPWIQLCTSQSELQQHCSIAAATAAAPAQQLPLGGELLYLLYMIMSGVQIISAGSRIDWTPP